MAMRSLLIISATVEEEMADRQEAMPVTHSFSFTPFIHPPPHPPSTLTVGIMSRSPEAKKDSKTRCGDLIKTLNPLLCQQLNPEVNTVMNILHVIIMFYTFLFKRIIK